MELRSYAQTNTIWIDGFIYSQFEDGPRAVPFATVSYCDSKDHDNILYTRFTDFRGFYDLGKEVPVQDYYVRIEAHGYIVREKTIGNLPVGFDKDMTLHYQMEKTTSNDAVVLKQVYGRDIKKECPKIGDAFKKLGFIVEDQRLLFGGNCPVGLLINGFSVNNSDDIYKLNGLSIRLVQSFDIYTINDQGSFPFKMVLNLVLKDGNKADGSLNGIPYETSYFDIQ